MKKEFNKKYIIEHVNQRLKYSDRISLGKNRINKTFLSNIYLALLLIFFLKKDKNKIYYFCFFNVL